MRKVRLGAAGMAATALLFATGMAVAQETKFMATLSGGEEVPPVETSATGMADVTFDTGSKELSWSIEFSGLSGPATAAHFHGPAAPGENAGPVITIEDLESPSEGSATLTDEQIEQLTGGQWYVNVHTEANPNGEIRGQVMEGSM
jgi:hypothetical protein